MSKDETTSCKIAKRIYQTGFSQTNGFYFRTGQYDTCCVGIYQLVIKRSPFILYIYRRLLLNKKELEKLQREMKNPGFTIVPVRLFINEKGLAKLVIALAKGKKEYDKRESIKEKDDRRDMARMFKR